MDHVGYGPLDADLLALTKQVEDATNALGITNQVLQNVHQQWKNARDAAGMSVSRTLWNGLLIEFSSGITHNLLPERV